MITDGKHFPADTDRFVFDSEVSQVFENMANRSIPMYAEVHRLHASMVLLSHPASEETPLIVYDIGASRGGFLRELCSQCSVSAISGASYLTFVAVDSSPSMLDGLSGDMPWVQTVCSDVLALPDFAEKADVISMFYLLQFIQSSADQLDVLRWVYRNLKPNGLFMSGHKGEPIPAFSTAFDSLYYAFRRANGYTPQEIEAKTKALKNSMWPCRPECIEDQCYRAGFTNYTETTRWLQFYTSVCTKGG